MRNVYIVSAARTPIARFQGAFASMTAPQLGSIAIAECIKRGGLKPDSVDEVIMGCVLAAGLGQNPARQAAKSAGVPDSAPSFVVNKVCGSGLKAVVLAVQSIKAGDNEVVVAGGMESMSNVPYILPSGRGGAKFGHVQLLDSMISDGLWDAYSNIHMGETAERVAAKYGVSREDQDKYSAESQLKASSAVKAGKFKAEIVPVGVPQSKGEPVICDTDEGPRADTTLEKLAKLRPAFRKENGTVTAGNASTINDGAAALVIASEDAVKKHGLRPLARITGYASSGIDPQFMLMAPVLAVQKLEKICGIGATDFDLVELNEAFAAGAVALLREIKLDPAKVNVNGGAIALGHPIGCSGARILVTLVHALKDRGLKSGIASLCIGGGNAVAMGVEIV